MEFNNSTVFQFAILFSVYFTTALCIDLIAFGPIRSSIKLFLASLFLLVLSLSGVSPAWAIALGIFVGIAIGTFVAKNRSLPLSKVFRFINSDQVEPRKRISLTDMFYWIGAVLSFSISMFYTMAFETGWAWTSPIGQWGDFLETSSFGLFASLGFLANRWFSKCEKFGWKSNLLLLTSLGLICFNSWNLQDYWGVALKPCFAIGFASFGFALYHLGRLILSRHRNSKTSIRLTAFACAGIAIPAIWLAWELGTAKFEVIRVNPVYGREVLDYYESKFDTNLSREEFLNSLDDVERLLRSPGGNSRDSAKFLFGKIVTTIWSRMANEADEHFLTEVDVRLANLENKIDFKIDFQRSTVTYSEMPMSYYRAALFLLGDKETRNDIFRYHRDSTKRLVAILRVERCRIACLIYKIRNGNLPQSIDKLSQGLNFEIPEDPYADQPITIRFGKSPKILCYSVGENGVDDQGAFPEYDRIEIYNYISLQHEFWTGDLPIAVN